MAPIYICGHSLGAAEADLYAYSRIKRGRPVDGVYTFGNPRPGNSAVGVATAAIPIWRAIRNGSGGFPDYDLVTAVPFDVEALLDYAQPAPFEEINEVPLPDDPWGILRYHHSGLYAAGCRKLPPTGSGAAVELVEAIGAVQDLYDGTGAWAVPHFVDGAYWAMRVMPSGARLVVFRGSVTPTDWIHDLRTAQMDLDGAMVSEGFWAGVGASLGALDAALA